MEIRRVLSRPTIFSIADRAEDIETLNAILARLRQRFRTVPSLKFISASMPLIRLGPRFPRSSRLSFVIFKTSRLRATHDRQTRGGSDRILN